MSDFPIKVRANLIKANNLPMSTTSTAIKTYINWLEQKVAETEWGEVSISFTICNSQITDIKKGSIDSEHYPLKRKGE
jgi:hypothetical protein